MSTADPIVWHYTIGHHFQGIVRDRAIRPSAVYASGQGRPAVWFSTNQDWEPMAAKTVQCADGSGRLMGRDELHTIGASPMRIGVSPAVAPHNWHDFKRIGELSPKAAGSINSLAVRLNSKPSWWFATLEAVPREQWQAVEHFDGWVWLPVPAHMW